ncbi:alanyl-tRNA editing protein [Bacillus suaedaesalsae]|uniref:Alanyl-tRNA editing protein n=1 Tax=Bacillus suaedaesalsae TaxID=2810349 RepID=A0ABS2DDL2_9BACI|nr:DHHA1 domain-containing protein [Bacillus suaedaesalsae]MBM6616516.1 alanyl-tRNA editing protein [Bacillus suaedaesalsae]
MTTKLYYEDAYQRSFSSNIVKQEQDNNGNLYITLEETAFYPTGGGQPYDKGTLNGVTVLGVEEVDGEIRHYVDRVLEGNKVDGVIDWERRFDHMQQHAGQHILSAAFVEQYGFETVSFHLGQETLTIDIQTEQLTEEQASIVEDLANQIILENRLIETKWVTEEEALQYPLRKKLAVTDDVRLVIIPNFDYNGCGGTHPNATGQVSAIKIVGWEKQKKNTRVEFVCGYRVLKQLKNKNKVVTEVGRLLSAPELEVTATVKRLLDQGKAMEKTIDDLRDQLLQFEAQTLINNAKDGYVSEVLQNRTMQELQKLARIVTGLDERIVTIFVTENSDKQQIVVARGKSTSGSMKTLINDILPSINGKGGGNDLMAQGGGEVGNTSNEQLLEFAVQKAKSLVVGIS